MAHLVDTYKCEWREGVNNPELRRKSQQFVNTDETEVGIEFVDERGMQRPKYWEKDIIPLEDVTSTWKATLNALRESPDKRWVNVGAVSHFPHDGGAAVKVRQDTDRRVQILLPRRMVPERANEALANLGEINHHDARHPRSHGKRVSATGVGKRGGEYVQKGAGALTHRGEGASRAGAVLYLKYERRRYYVSQFLSQD